MNETPRKTLYAPASPPDLVVRLRASIDANETTRVLLTHGFEALAGAIRLHLDHSDAHLRQLIADLEGRADA